MSAFLAIEPLFPCNRSGWTLFQGDWKPHRGFCCGPNYSSLPLQLSNRSGVLPAHPAERFWVCSFWRNSQEQFNSPHKRASVLFSARVLEDEATGEFAVCCTDVCCRCLRAVLSTGKDFEVGYRAARAY